MARKFRAGMISLLGAALAYLYSVTEKLHFPWLPQWDTSPQLQRREDDPYSLVPDEGPHPDSPDISAPAVPANPVIGFRYGQNLLEAEKAFVLPRFYPFIPFQETPANPGSGG